MAAQRLLNTFNWPPSLANARDLTTHDALPPPPPTWPSQGSPLSGLSSVLLSLVLIETSRHPVTAGTRTRQRADLPARPWLVHHPLWGASSVGARRAPPSGLPQHLHPLPERHIHRDPGRRQPVEVALELGADAAVLLHEFLHPRVVAVALEGEDLR